MFAIIEGAFLKNQKLCENAGKPWFRHMVHLTYEQIRPYVLIILPND